MNVGTGRIRIDKYAAQVQRAEGGYTAVSSKSRAMAEDISDAELQSLVKDDIAEAISKYHGERYVRRPGLDVTGDAIRIDEIVVNYDKALVPENVRKAMAKFTGSHGGVDVKIGFFE